MSTHLHIHVLPSFKSMALAALEPFEDENYITIDTTNRHVTLDGRPANLTSLYLDDVPEKHIHEIMAAFEAKLIPYDAEFGRTDDHDSAEVSFRVLDNGTTQKVELDEQGDAIPLDKLIASYQEGTIESLISDQLAKTTVLSWEKQFNVVENKKRLARYMETNIHQTDIDGLVDDMARKLAELSGEDADYELAEHQATEINNGGLEVQVNYLVQNGFWLQDVRKEPSTYITPTLAMYA